MHGIVPKLSGSPGKVKHTGQMLGESNEAVYKGLLKLDDAQYTHLCENAVI